MLFLMKNKTFGLLRKQTKIHIKSFKSAGINISSKSLRAMLKVCLYTLLNGGNPASDERVFETLKANAGAERCF
jgi:hypothetical protein